MDSSPLSTPGAERPWPGRLSVRTGLILLVMAALLPAGALCAWFLQVQASQARAAAYSEVKLLADSVAATLALTLRDQKAVMERLAERPGVKALDADRFDPGVAEYLRVHPQYNNLGVRASDARLVFAGRQGAISPPEAVRTFPWFVEGLAKGGFMASDAYKGNLSGRWVTVLTQPIRDDSGQVIGLMNLSQDLQALNQRVLGSVPAGAVVGVVDRQGRYLLRSADLETWVGKPGPAKVQQDTAGQREGFISATGPDGVTRLYAFVTMADTGWRIIAGQPEAQVLAGPQSLLQRSLLIGLAILMLALLAAWWVGRAIIRPIAALAAAAARVGAGDNQARAAIGGPREIQTVAQEFNAMVRARSASDEALRDSEMQLAITLQSIGDAVVATDLAGRVTRMNATAERLTGWTVADARGRPLADVFRIVDARTRQPALDPVKQVLGSGHIVGLANGTALLARDGREYQIADSAAPIVDHAGQTVGVVLVFSDVTQRYQAEKALRESASTLELRDRALAEISQGVMITDAHGHITYVNPGFERLTGYAADAVIGKTSRFLQGPASAPGTVAALSQALRAGQGFHGEILNYRADGSTMWIELDISPLRDESGLTTGFVGVQHDITERRLSELARRELETQLRESQKMESIGTLAGGIAHDFNNVLGAILGNLALARDAVGSDHAARPFLEQIQRAGLRARDLVRQILTFSRRQAQELRVQPMQPIVHETVALLRSALPAMIDLVAVMPEQPIHVNADATQIQQVLMNLCTNAWHALPDQTGRIEFGLDEQALDTASALASGDLRAGRYAHLWVRDTGSGMDAATRARMFEPFFTTKAVGDGTGLGLAVVHGIVKSHGGGIRVTSVVGSGTLVDLYFPIADPQGGAEDSGSGTAAARGHGEHVLYVDDDEVMRLVAQRLLERAGLRVRTVSTIDEALRSLAPGEPTVDAVVTDFNMPEGTGLDLARQVRRVLPELPVVVASGYFSDELRRGAQKTGVRHLVQKQNLHDDLVPTVLRALSERSTVQAK